MLENHLLHVLARVAVRAATPLRAMRFVEAAGGWLPPLSTQQAQRVAAALEGRGTCLSRSLAIAARLPSAEVVIGGSLVPGGPLAAHAWVERGGQAISPTHGHLREIGRFKREPDTRIADARLHALLASMPDDRPRLARLCEGVDDWDALFQLARIHGLAGALYAEIEASGYSLPGDVARREARALAYEALLHDTLVRGLAGALRELAADGIQVVALKGPILGERLYDHPEHRHSSDLDLLVRPEDVERAAAAIARVGYVLEGGALGRYYRAHHHNVNLVHPTLGVVELHFEAYRGFGVALLAGPLLDRATRYRTARWSASILSPEDELIYLAMHGAGHRFERLGWLYDLKLFVRAHPGLDWSVARARADALGVGSALSLTCTMLSSVLGVPPAWGDSVAPLGAVRARAMDRLFSRRESAVADAAARFGFHTILCQTPALAAKSAASAVALKVLRAAIAASPE